MTSEFGGKENARTRYDAKKPTVSFRVSIEEYERLDALRKGVGRSFRDIILTGAGMIEKDKVRERKRRADEKKKLEDAVKAAKTEGLKKVQIGVCRRCGNPHYWDLTKIEQRKIISDYLWQFDHPHSECVHRLQRLKNESQRPRY
jgi:hypothetical protein